MRFRSASIAWILVGLLGPILILEAGVQGSFFPGHYYYKFLTTPHGGKLTFNSTGWSASLNESAVACQVFPQNIPINVTAFHPKNYPFIKWITTGYATIENYTSNPSNVTFTKCPTWTDRTVTSLSAVFNGPAVSLPTDTTLLLTMMMLTSIVFWRSSRKKI